MNTENQQTEAIQEEHAQPQAEGGEQHVQQQQEQAAEQGEQQQDLSMAEAEQQADKAVLETVGDGLVSMAEKVLGKDLNGDGQIG